MRERHVQPGRARDNGETTPAETPIFLWAKFYAILILLDGNLIAILHLSEFMSATDFLAIVVKCERK